MESTNINNIDTNKVLHEIEAQLEANKSGLIWAGTHLKADSLASTRDNLVSNRLNLKRVKRALEVNPGAAVFGESQVGKSYLVQNLLKNKKGIFNVMSDKTRSIGFIESLNPSGGGVESTSLITRFTVRDEIVNESYPIKAMIYSPTDIILTLCDTYYSDVKNHTFPKENKIKEHLNTLQAKYAGKSRVQEHLTEEDLYEIKEYLNPTLFPIAKSFLDDLNEQRYFETISTFIGSVPAEEWRDVFGFLWNSHSIINDVFSRLVKVISKIDFARQVYINIEPLKKVSGTVLCVDRIREFFKVDEDEKGTKINKASVSEMEVWTGDKVERLSKSEFTAIAIEVVLRVPDDVESEKPFLQQLDILDFPGARSRENYDESNIDHRQACTMLLRGRVAYLFNKYTSQYLINNLLFCHHVDQSNVKSLSHLLKRWIDVTIGDNPEARLAQIQSSELAPLFIVGTKFNIDLKRDNSKDIGTEENQEEERKQRWYRRFDRTLTELISESKDNNWFSNWTPGTPFKNMYLLRDYTYSTETFGGYFTKEGNIRYDAGASTAAGEISKKDEVFLNNLRKTFVNYEFVKQHFSNPATAWDRAAELNQDGSEWIIENLTKSSKQVIQLRDNNFKHIITESFYRMCDKLRNFYHDDDSDLELTRQLASAGKICLTLDVLFGRKPYFFSEFLSSMLITEEKLHDRILDIISTPQVVEKTDLSELFALRDKAGVSSELSYEENVQRMYKTYYCSTEIELRNFLKNFNITIEDIINPPKVQNLAQIIAESIEQYWFENYLTAERLNKFSEYGFTESMTSELIGNMRALYTTKLQLTEHLIRKIRPYVTSPEKLGDMAEMLADIIAEMFNKFINTMGTAYFTKEMWDDVKASVEHNKFEGQVEIKEEDHDEVYVDEEQTRLDMTEVFEVFDNMDSILNNVESNRDKLSYFSNYHSFRRWTENMKVGFLATCNIPKYDVNMNNQLRGIFVNSILKKEEFTPYINNNDKLKKLSEEMLSKMN